MPDECTGDYMVRKNYSSYNRDHKIERSKIMWIDIYLEELVRACENVEELRKFEDNHAANKELKRQIKYAEEMLIEVKEWLKD